MHIWVYACVHIHLTSLCGPPVRSGAPVPPWFSCPMVSCWADISVCLDDSLTWCLFGLATCFHLNRYAAQRKKGSWLSRVVAIRSERRSALTWRSAAEHGQGRRETSASQHGRFQLRLKVQSSLLMIKSCPKAASLTFWSAFYFSPTGWTNIQKAKPSFVFWFVVFKWNEKSKWALSCRSLPQQHYQGKANKTPSEWNES